ncbi:eukaryotic translation initiation factor 4E-like protein [Acanthamoeba castellanii mimivirus]|uniref:Eukaryotic translation initiation factor 4E homolog n=5 Tax=Mimivirus TaxID=315393 RepID=IF4EH_MIMIV|nr:eukaryotic translation initiation factor 4E-like protein [Acanthamoeba polyphaga mimivirus]Q5UQG4.1 RecName: Full=Eukaryotic translation initiation factor 4E homolog; Short=eIF-4E; Short=eIF4E; AltName: Full=mRNA cap-binding protein [Acanthamoeba polyphaga mimivirus]AHA45359.1 eukaryotic translation initiation factor 4E-like protein [Hirudovirus strain Sangsue]AHJ40165.2 eukaryotic translation initiation factor 4e-like protein [Samba virus]ALR84085.1 eukaryotic translation initiation factor 
MDSNNTEFKDNYQHIPDDIPLTNIKLPNEWVLYLYDKQLFKKMANRPNFQAKPHKALCTISTVNDLLYIMELMKVNNDPKIKSVETDGKINLDANDYIIMRKGIEPIWEDPRNSNGGTFTVKMDHSKGYDVWKIFIQYILGETLTSEISDMKSINGITVSYISDSYNFQNPASKNTLGNTLGNSLGNSLGNGLGNSFTYIKIWDGKPDRTRDQFVSMLPATIIDKIKSDSLMYSQNSKKKHFNEKNIIGKLNSGRKPSNTRGGFSSFGNKRY